MAGHADCLVSHMKLQFFALLLLLSMLSMVRQYGSTDLAPAGAHHLQTVAGLEEGLCCKVRGGAPCHVFGSINCSAPMPHQCWCDSPGSACIDVVEWPMNHDICVPTEVVSSCSLGVQYCFIKRESVCDDDGGAWSWLYLCTRCGCLLDDNLTQTLEGTRNTCAAGTICP